MSGDVLMASQTLKPFMLGITRSRIAQGLIAALDSIRLLVRACAHRIRSDPGPEVEREAPSPFMPTSDDLEGR